MAIPDKDKALWTEFIELYRDHPCSWKIKSSEYRNSVERNRRVEQYARE